MAAPIPEQTRSPVIAAGGLGLGQMLAFGSSFYLMGVLGDGMSADLHVRPSFAASLMSLAFLASALAAPAVGKAVDRRGGKGVLLASNLVFVAGLLLVGTAPAAWAIALGLSVIGIGMAMGLYATPFAILVSLYGDRARRPITAVSLIGGLGSTVGWPLTLAFEQHFGWRGACFAWAAVQALVCLPINALAVPRTTPEPHDPEAPAVRIAWDRPMIQLAVLFAGAWFVSTCMSAHLPQLLAAFGLTPAQAAGTAALVGVAAVSVRFAEITVLRRFHPLAATRVATLMHPLGALAIGVLGAAGAPLMALGQGAGNGMLTVAKGVLPLELYGQRHYAYRSALLSRPASFAQIGGPVIYGLAIDHSRWTALGLSAGLCLVMFAMTFGLKSSSAAPYKDLPA
jgi:MFS family permease